MTKVVNTSTMNGYKIYILEMNMPIIPQFHNGYVVLDKDHELYQVDYDDIDIDIHGGLTFSEDHLQEIVLPEENKWVLGFDTSHSFDTPETSSKEAVWHYLNNLTLQLKEKNYDFNKEA